MRPPRRLKLLSDDDLKLLTVERLLAYRQKALSLENSLLASDYAGTTEALDPKYIWFKDDARWTDAYNRTLTVLHTKQRDA